MRSRLARVVCADPEQLADGDLEAIAAAVEEAQIDAIAAALARVAERVPAGAPVVAVGVGAFLARAAADRCGLTVRPEVGRERRPRRPERGGGRRGGAVGARP